MLFLWEEICMERSRHTVQGFKSMSATVGFWFTLESPICIILTSESVPEA